MCGVRIGGMDATISARYRCSYLEVEELQAMARALLRLALQLPTLMQSSRIASIAGMLEYERNRE